MAARRSYWAGRSAAAGSPPAARGTDEASRPSTGLRTHLSIAALGIAASVAALAYVTGATGRTAHFNDFYREAWPAYAALEHGHMLEFLRFAPAYVGSLVLRAPFAMIPSLWAGGARAIYFASAVPCMLAAVVFCAWLGAQPRRQSGITWVSRIGPLIYCLFNPLVLTALLAGHPEDVLGAVLCVGAVVLAVNGRVEWAVFLIGLAVVNKSWALVAVPVVLVVLPPKRRRTMLIAGAAAGTVLIPIMALRNGGLSLAATGAQIGTIFNPPQLLWWFGSHSWIARHARPAIVLLAFVCATVWWLQRARTRPSQGGTPDALLLLALVLLLRAALDPWNNLYYHVPFLFALIAYEVRSGRMPVFGVVYSVVILFVVPNSNIPPMSHDVRAAVYAVAVVPAIGWLVAKLYLPPGAWRRRSVAGRRPLPPALPAEKITA